MSHARARRLAVAQSLENTRLARAENRLYFLHQARFAGVRQDLQDVRRDSVDEGYNFFSPSKRTFTRPQGANIVARRR